MFRSESSNTHIVRTVLGLGLVATTVHFGCHEEPAIESTLEVCSVSDSDQFDVLGAEISGDILRVELSHGGGCAEHDYRMCWDGQVGQDSAPSISLNLIHNAYGDPCQALLHETLEIDLTPLRAAYRERHGSGRGRVVLDFAGGLTYRFRE